MHKVVLWIQGVLVPFLGPAGLFVAAFCDSSFLSLPEINDLLVVTSSSARPHAAWLYVLLATTGSVAGCLVLWTLGRRGGEPLLERRFGVERVQRTRAVFARWDVLALAIPSMLPPPMPFKIFVLSAGVFGFPAKRMIITLLIARGLRYTFWAILGVFWGKQALELLQRFDSFFGRRIPIVLSVAAAVIMVGVFLFTRKERAEPGPGGPAKVG
ncbi:MAG TPA: VTT domain-containing protein [Vicinamibacteria bacterium]|jgi:membrane protein YqaA with SNARE-associated domain